MNLSPRWCAFLEEAGHHAQHWVQLGAATAPDDEGHGDCASTRGCCVTNDLDFGTLLALTGATGPSVVQVRTADLVPESIGSLVVSALRQFEKALGEGAIVVVEPDSARARILPIRRSPSEE